MDERKILVIEDEKKIADTLKRGLTENGFEVDVAYDGKIGYQQFKAGKYDLIILSINLPGMNGYDLCKMIRYQSPSMRIMMLTSMSTLENKVEGYDAGADDYLVKPFEFRELLLQIRTLLKRTPGEFMPVGNSLKVADLEMNLDNKEVLRSGKKIKLTAKEFQLLEYLLRNKNQVVSRADLASNVWDVDCNANTNVIDVYISYVRNKIDRDFEQKLIQTQVGMGYILKEGAL